MAQENENYKRIAALLKDGHIRRLTAQGMSEAEAAKKAEKMAIEDARFVLPNACDTKMVVTMNARSLQNFFRHRCSTGLSGRFGRWRTRCCGWCIPSPRLCSRCPAPAA